VRASIVSLVAVILTAGEFRERIVAFLSDLAHTDPDHNVRATTVPCPHFTRIAKACISELMRRYLVHAC
jgi:hypothetical protein